MWIPSLKLSIGEEMRCPSSGTYGRASPYVLRESLSLCSFLAIQDSSEPTHSNKAWDNPLKRKELSSALGAIASLPVLLVKSTWAQSFYWVGNGKPFQCPYCLEKDDGRYREKRSGRPVGLLGIRIRKLETQEVVCLRLAYCSYGSAVARSLHRGFNSTPMTTQSISIN